MKFENVSKDFENLYKFEGQVSYKRLTKYSIGYGKYNCKLVTNGTIWL
jgi:hypothetical protein